MLLDRRVARIAAGQELRARRAPTTAPPPRRTPSAASRTSAPACGCRRCCATPRRASCTPASTSGSSASSWPRCSSSSTTSSPASLKFLHGSVYEAYAFGADLAGVVFLVGIGWAIVRRYIQRPYRIRIKTKPEDAVILGTFLAHRRHRVPHRRRSASRSSAARLREVVVHRLPAVGPREELVAELAARRAPLALGHPRGRVPRLPCDPARRPSCATCSRRR